MREKYEVCCDLFHGFDRSKWLTGSAEERLKLLPAAQEHILAQEDGKNRLLRVVQELSRAFTLAMPHEAALRIRDDVAFFQAFRSVLAKRAPGKAKPEEELDHAIRRYQNRAIEAAQVIEELIQLAKEIREVDAAASN